jgi:hypothetical protein
MNADEQTRHPAEDRALAIREAAEARAAALAAAAKARAKALSESSPQRLPVPIDLHRPPPRLQKIAKEYIAKYLPLSDEFREAVSIRAYYKAENREFGPGQEGLDWIEAEQDVLDIPSFGDDASHR